MANPTELDNQLRPRLEELLRSLFSEQIGTDVDPRVYEQDVQHFAQTVLSLMASQFPADRFKPILESALERLLIEQATAGLGNWGLEDIGSDTRIFADAIYPLLLDR